MWPPVGAIIEQCEKGTMCCLSCHGNACMICAFCSKNLFHKSQPAGGAREQVNVESVSSLLQLCGNVDAKCHGISKLRS